MRLYLSIYEIIICINLSFAVDLRTIQAWFEHVTFMQFFSSWEPVLVMWPTILFGSCRWQWLPRVNRAVLQSDSFSLGLNITEGNCNSLMPLQSQLRTQGVLGLQEGPFTSFSQLLPRRDCSKTGILVSNLLTLHEHLNLRRWLTTELRVKKKKLL